MSPPPNPKLSAAKFSELVGQMEQIPFGAQQIIETGKVTMEFFPEGFIALNKELATGLHKNLEVKLGNHPPHEVDTRLAEIADHCYVVLDGTYTLAERDKLCYILAGRLEVLRDVAPPEIILQ